MEYSHYDQNGKMELVKWILKYWGLQFQGWGLQTDNKIRHAVGKYKSLNKMIKLYFIYFIIKFEIMLYFLLVEKRENQKYVKCSKQRNLREPKNKSINELSRQVFRVVGFCCDFIQHKRLNNMILSCFVQHFYVFVLLV